MDWQKNVRDGARIKCGFVELVVIPSTFNATCDYKLASDLAMVLVSCGSFFCIISSFTKLFSSNMNIYAKFDVSLGKIG